MFRRKPPPQAVLTCDEVVAKYAAILEHNPSGGAALPYEPELIKASIVARAVELGTPEAHRICREGFIALDVFSDRFRKRDLTVFSEEEIIELLTMESNRLSEEFERRVALKQEFADA
jgi:hypothetical protein